MDLEEPVHPNGYRSVSKGLLFQKRQQMKTVNLHFEIAREDHLPEIVRLLADDDLGSTREEYTNPPIDSYINAFRKINNDQGEELIVAMDDVKVVGCLQLSIIPYLTYKGSSRAQIEGVRVDSNYRGNGIGKKLLEFTIEKARQRGVIMVQLTSTSSRKDAIKFYENLGFKSTHVGLKLTF
jgi:ribosomal protein S18 acetylase RimI-like enzyme